MTTRSRWYRAGYDRGTSFAVFNTTAEDAFDAEDNARQFSPFEFTASDINRLPETERERAWTAFDQGVGDAILDHFNRAARLLAEEAAQKSGALPIEETWEELTEALESAYILAKKARFDDLMYLRHDLEHALEALSVLEDIASILEQE